MKILTKTQVRILATIKLYSDKANPKPPTVTSRIIKKGQKFTNKNLTFKRPGNGINPFEIKKVLGKISKKNYKIDEIIKL